MERRAILKGAAGLWVGALLAAPAFSGAPLGLGTALNMAGRQRMLTQRTAKAWLMLGLGVLPALAHEILDKSVIQLEQHLATLTPFLPNNEVAPAMAALRPLWAELRATAALPAKRDYAERMYSTSESAQAAAHHLTLAYEKSARNAADRLINVAGRQRMLSQRIAKFFLFRAWNVNAASAQMELNFARAEFSSGMHQLYQAGGDSGEIHAAIEQLDREWVAYRDLLGVDLPATRRRAPTAELMMKSESILEVAERLVALFERNSNSAAA